MAVSVASSDNPLLVALKKHETSIEYEINAETGDIGSRIES